VPAQKFLSCVKRTRERFGAGHLISVLRGSQNERVRRLGHDRLSTYGIGRDLSEEEWRRIARELVRGGFLKQDLDDFSALKVTDSGEAVLFRGQKVSITVRQTTRTEAEPTGSHADLFERLRALRKRLADEQGVPPYVIFHDRALREMAARLPRDREALLRIPGIGHRKAADYGKEFLAEVAAYVTETGAEPEPLEPPPPRRRKSRGELSESAWETLQLFQEGMNVAEIAAVRDKATSTVEGHLVDAMDAGEQVDLDRLVSSEKQATIREAMELLGADLLGPVMQYLGDGYTYGELRLMRAAILTDK
jgi:ATP-dependent DNA helicase RecQ